MGIGSYLVARGASNRINALEDRVVFLEHQVRDLKKKLNDHGIQ
jgi:hypothetical protein